jgi:hypothetical protein
MKMEFICPKERKWLEVHEILQDARLAKLRNAFMNREKLNISLPPEYLPTTATDADKKLRWQETVQWAEKHGLVSVIPNIKDEESVLAFCNYQKG